MKTNIYPMSPDAQRELSEKVHGIDKFDYSGLNTIRHSKEKISLLCKTCGRSILVRWASHIGGTGCRKCENVKKGLSRRLPDEEIKLRIEARLPGVFNLDSYRREGQRVYVECKKHGGSWVNLYSLLSGHNGCVGCTGGKRTKLTFEEFRSKSELAHPGSNYIYKEYKDNNKTKVQVECRLHGIFHVQPNAHMSGNIGCHKCNVQTSTYERSILSFLKTIYEGDIILNTREVLPSKKELDFYIPELKLAIEVNGVYYHSLKFRKDIDYHLAKTEEAEKQGIQLIHIFSDEWVKKKNIVKDRLKSIVGTSRRIFARKLTSTKANWQETRQFLEEHHIQGAGSATSDNYFLVDSENNKVACMTFSKARFIRDKSVWELVRYCSSGTVVGGFSKLLSQFKLEHSPDKIVSYADRRWSLGNVYSRNGFQFTHNTKPGYFYSNSLNQRFSRVLFQKHKLERILKEFDPTLTEEENCNKNGWYRIYDSGHKVFVMEIKNPGL